MSEVKTLGSQKLEVRQLKKDMNRMMGCGAVWAYLFMVGVHYSVPMKWLVIPVSGVGTSVVLYH